MTSNPPPVAELLKQLQVDEAGRAEIAALPQGTPGWKRSRFWRLTASNFGAAAGHQGKAKRMKLLKDMVWPETAGLTGFVQRMAQYGTDHENIARYVYMTDRVQGNPNYTSKNFRIFETGLLVSTSHGWLGASPDFVVEEPLSARPPPTSPPANVYHLHDPYVIEHIGGHYVYLRAGEPVPHPPSEADGPVVQGCGEIKCPAAKVKVFYSQKEEHTMYGFPAMYYDQIQGAMAINSWPWCDAVVFTPERTQVTRFYRNTAYWSKTLFPKLRSFYFDLFLPMLHKRVEGVLPYGEIVDLSPTVPRPLLLLTEPWISPHPDIVDPLQWFGGKIVHFTFVTIP
jgi:hypothetical protein